MQVNDLVRNTIIVGLVGKVGEGKTTAAKELEKKGYRRISFSTALKNMLITAGLCTPEEAFVTKPPPVRVLLQKIGTEIFRNQVDKYFWCQKLVKSIVELQNEGITKFVVDDVRFLDEAETVRILGGKLIRIIRDGYSASLDNPNHASERELESIKCDKILTIPDGNVDELKVQVLQAVTELIKS